MSEFRRLIEGIKQNKIVALGLIVAPLGLYSGMLIKNYRQEKQYPQVPNQFFDKGEVVQDPPSSPQKSEESPETMSKVDIQRELNQLDAYRSTLLRDREMLLDEKRIIEAKFKRLEELDRKLKEKK
ncbi:hypothetical protein H4219_001241 [Mycoemilia scoparia]|uniref:Uncharacterized protein n=1 Tax=Mycoemilia scoparia TaxID=417184 RepID=A0A9W8A1H5_9FUNG|nr:hypothetical protein H4219_001241 [Mycoemilia scoparia]